jgi:hypothetical protein
VVPIIYPFEWQLIVIRSGFKTSSKEFADKKGVELKSHAIKKIGIAFESVFSVPLQATFALFSNNNFRCCLKKRYFYQNETLLAVGEWAHLESNQGPTGYEPVALPTELWARTS